MMMMTKFQVHVHIQKLLVVSNSRQRNERMYMVPCFCYVMQCFIFHWANSKFTGACVCLHVQLFSNFNGVCTYTMSKYNAG